MPAVTHHLPPDPGVTEIRVHGVGGAPPEAVLEQTGVHQATGDTIAGFFRGTINPPGRVVEAYSWGGLTARSRSRALWVLLLPFTLINLAGWMVEPEPAGRRGPDGQPGRPKRSRSFGTKCHEVLVQLVGLFATALYVAWAAQLALNMVAFQCGAIPDCRQDRWYVSYFSWEFFTDSPGRRVVVALVVPLGLLALFGVLGHRSARRFDDFGSENRPDFTTDRSAPGSVLAHAGLWFPGPWRAQLVLAHLAITLLLLAGLLGRASREFELEFGVAVVPDLGYPLFGLCLAAGLVVAGTVGWATWRRAPVPAPTTPVLVILRVVLAVAVLAMLVAAALTWQLDLPDDRLVTRVEAGSGQPAEATTDLWGFGWAPIMLLALGIAAVAVFSLIQLWRWLVERRSYLDQFAVVVMVAFIGLWRQALWVAVAALVGAAVAVAVGQLDRRDPEQRGDPQAAPAERSWWRWGVLVGVCLAGAATQRLTVNAPDPFGPDWPRLTPLLLFTAILVLLTVGQTSGWGPNNRHGRKPWPVPVAVVGLPVGLLGLGWLVTGWWGGSIGWLAGLALLSWLLLAVAWLAQFQEPGLDRWRWNGPAAAGALALATLMGAFAALATWLADLLGGDGSRFVLSATAIYEWVALMFAAMLAVILLGFAFWLGLVRLGIGGPGTGGQPFRRQREPDRNPRPVTLGGRTLAEAVRGGDVVLTMGTLLLAGAVLALLVHLAGEYRWELQLWIDDRPPGDWQPVVQLGLLVCLATVFGWFLLVRRGLRDPVFRTRIGVLWDTATFWPRWFHPFAPPAYSTRAVPELQARLAEVTSGGAVVLSAHSQGSVVAVAALASLDPPLLARIRLVTHGSPLTRFYHRFFPSYFSRELLDDGARRLGTTPELADGGWLNFWRGTDPIGDPVFGAQPRQPPPDRPPAGVRDALERHGRTATTLPDVELGDPLPAIAPAGPGRYAPEPEIRGHSGYAADPAMWGTLAGLADELRERL